jgi:nicotinamidase-related amidase
MGVGLEDIVCAKESEMNTALVIVDMLWDFVDGRLANPAATPTIERIGALAKAARRRKDWMVVNDAHHPGDVELRLFGEHAMVGTPGAQVVEELVPAGGDIVVPERYYSAFTQIDLAATCLVQDVGRVVIVGQHTDCCVRHTSYDAFLGGFEVVVPADATAVFQPYRRSRSRPARSGHWTPCGPSTGCGWWAPPTCSARQATRWPSRASQQPLPNGRDRHRACPSPTAAAPGAGRPAAGR